MRESDLLHEVLRLADIYDVLAFHVTDSRYAYGKGYPDLTLSGTARTIFAELKIDDTSKGYLKPEQREWRQRLEDGGEEYYLWRPRHLQDGTIEEVVRSLNDE